MRILKSSIIPSEPISITGISINKIYAVQMKE